MSDKNAQLRVKCYFYMLFPNFFIIKTEFNINFFIFSVLFEASDWFQFRVMPFFDQIRVFLLTVRFRISKIIPDFNLRSSS